MDQTLYDILGVKPDAAADEIKHAYRKLAGKWHPDKNKGHEEHAAEMFKSIAHAYTVLKDKVSRKAYDDELAFAYSSSSDYEESSTSDEKQSEQTDSHDEPDEADDFAEQMFWEEMLDLAFELRTTGMEEREIALNLTRAGCPANLAVAIAKAACKNAQKSTTNNATQNNNSNHDSMQNEDETIEDYTAFIGSRSTDYYLDKFLEFDSQKEKRKISFAPGVFGLILLSIFWSLPITIWMLARKQWVLWGKQLLWLIATVVASLPGFAVIDNNQGLGTLLLAPAFFMFVYTILYPCLMGNYFYHQKAKYHIRQSKQLYRTKVQRLMYLRRKGGGVTPLLIIVILIPIIGILAAIALPAYQDYTTRAKEAQTNSSYSSSPTQQSNLTAEEQYDLGWQYYSGEGGHQDYQQAFSWFDKAANKGSVHARYLMGFMLKEGQGIAQDLKRAEVQLSTAASNNSQYAYLELGKMYSMEGYFKFDFPLALKYYQNAINSTGGEAEYWIGKIYELGYSVTQNKAIALQYYKKALQQGYSDAQNDITLMNESGYY